MEKTREEIIALINVCNNEKLLRFFLELLRKYQSKGKF